MYAHEISDRLWSLLVEAHKGSGKQFFTCEGKFYSVEGRFYPTGLMYDVREIHFEEVKNEPQ